MAFAYAKNKGTDELCSNCTADQRLCFRFLHQSFVTPTYSAAPGSSGNLGSSPQFLEHFSLNLARSAKIDKALANLVNNPISWTPIKSLNQMSNNKITSFKSPSTDYDPTCIRDIFPYPLFQTSEFS